jgi:hypothetical protein
MQLFDILLRVDGMLVRLPGEFVRGEIVAFTVGGCSGGVGVGRKVVQFSGAVVIALGHFVLLPNYIPLSRDLISCHCQKIAYGNVG